MERRRIHVPGALYYVVLRAAHTRPGRRSRADHSQLDFLFSDDLDRDAFLRAVPRALNIAHARLHAYCLMPSDVRLLIEVSDVPLGRFVKHLTVSYSHWRNVRRNAQGHVFQHRYASVIVNEDARIREVVRHIHRSPVTGQRVPSPNEYRWSSHRPYAAAEALPGVTTRRVLRLFGNVDARARRAYRRYVARDDKACGGYAVADRPFMRQLLPLKRQAPAVATLEQIIRATCRRLDVSPKDLVSASRARHLCLARALVHRHARQWGIAGNEEVGERLNRDPSSLWVGAERYRQVYPELFALSLQQLLSTRGQATPVLPIRRPPARPPPRQWPTLTDAQLARRIERALAALSKTR